MLTLTLGAIGAESSAKTRPHIILCMADDQGWGDMAYNGHPVLKTPNFDAMAAEGLRFDRFYAAAPVCSPTRGSVLTGRNPNRFGCFKWGRTLREQEVTIAEVLKSAGYVTAHFGKWHLGPVRKGSPLAPGANGFDEWLSAPNFFECDPLFSREGKAVQVEGEGSMATVEAAIDFLHKHAKSSKPMFAVVWFGSPHVPHRAAPEDRAVYAEHDERMANFYGEITGLDRAVGRLRKELQTMGIRDNTVLWYCSDNGGLKEESTGGRGKKGSMYEGGMRVPAILEWPARLKKPRTTAMPCVTSDIYPTLVELVDAEVTRQPVLDGMSLVGLLEGKMDKRPGGIGFWQRRDAGLHTPHSRLLVELMEAQREGREITPHTHGEDAGKIVKQYSPDDREGHATWLEWPWKLHRLGSSNRKANYGKLELYNLAKDPMEKDDLAEEESNRAKAMHTRLDAWQKSVIRSLNGEDYKD